MDLPFKNKAWLEKKQKQKKAKASSGIGSRATALSSSKNIRQLLSECPKPSLVIKNNQYNYLSIEAPPSLRPIKKYCDVTGLPTSYQDRETKLNFANHLVLNYIRALAPPVVELYANIRKETVSPFWTGGRQR